MKMTKAQFARLLEVSPVTISNWENSDGPLNMRARTQKAWDTISNLTKKEGSYGQTKRSKQ
jgi:DNA-binding XRE family transcriptional regulator